MNDIGRRNALRQLLAVAGLAGSLPLCGSRPPLTAFPQFGYLVVTNPPS